MPSPKEAPPEFYSRQYFTEGSAGAGEYRQTEGSALDHYKLRVLELASPMPGEVVLDLGCGRGEVVLACLRAGCRTLGLDFSTDALSLTRGTVGRHAPDRLASLQLIHADACLVELRAESIDCVITTDFVEHILPDRLARVVARVYGWLKPRGRFVVHTSPTIGYMRFGQYVARGLECARGQKPQRLETFALQLRDGGHCNIQSVRSLRRLLSPFPSSNVWAEFSARDGIVKAALVRAGAAPLFAHHLFAVARKHR